MVNNTFANRWSPALSLLINPKDPTESIDLSGTGGDPRAALGAMMPPRDALTDDDWSHLVTGNPSQSQVAGEHVAPGQTKISDDDWSHLVTGKSAPPTSQSSQPASVSESVEQSRRRGLGTAATVRGALQTIIRQHPEAAAAYGGTAAAVTGLPLLGLGAYGAGAGMSALPAWAQLGTLWALNKGVGEIGGAPGIARGVHSLMDIVEGLAH